MAKPIAVVDYSKCQPEHCIEGLCAAVLACPRGLLKQEAAFEMPDPSPVMCLGCGTCSLACPREAIRLI